MGKRQQTFDVWFTPAQRRAIADVLPKLADRLRLDEPNSRAISFAPAELETIRRKANSGMDHDAVVEDWRQNAERHDEENYEFLRGMKFRDYGFDPDELAGELHEHAFQIVDCTRCAHCCKTLNIKFSNEDIQRIAGHLAIGIDEFVATYLELDEADGSYRAREKPCPFLGDDDRCTIYDVRPTACREYPHTDKPGFKFRTMGVANNALACPAGYWIVEQMKRRASG